MNQPIVILTLLSALLSVGGIASAATGYIESETLATGWYRVNLNTGEILPELSGSADQTAAESGPAAGIPYTTIDWMGMGRNQAAPVTPKGVYFNGSTPIEVDFYHGTSRAYGATQTSAGTAFSEIEWVGTVQVNAAGSTFDQYGAYQNPNGSFTYVRLNDGSLTTLTATQTTSGVLFNDITWTGLEATTNAVNGDVGNRYLGVYLNPGGTFTMVNLSSGAETLFSASAIAADGEGGDLEGMAFSEIPWVDVSASNTSTGGLNFISFGSFYVLNVPEPSAMLLGLFGGSAFLLNRRRTGNEVRG